MLGFMINPKHATKLFIAALILAIMALIYGISTGAFEQNNREALRQARETAAARQAGE
jgi:hypothetical protein